MPVRGQKLKPKDVVTSKPILMVLAAVAGALAGIQFDSPPPGRAAPVDFYVHALRMERSVFESNYLLSVYSTGIFTFLDGGSTRRDFGERRCPDADTEMLAKVGMALVSDCKAPLDAWAHVIEIRSAATDGGFDVEVYASSGGEPGEDGGRSARTDLGLTACNSAVPDIIDVISKEAFRCAEGALDEP